jgi:thiol:disulfide interchange protein DsbD
MDLSKLHVRALLCACLAVSAATGAGEDPVAWSASLTPSSHKPVARGAHFTVELQAIIQPGWHLYALDQPDRGPIATDISLAPGQPFSFAGTISAPKPHSLFDANFNMAVGFYIEKVQFRVPVGVEKTASAGATTLNIRARYQCCNDKMCLPPKTTTVAVPVEIQP